MAAAIYDILGVKPSNFRVVSGTATVTVPISYINTFELSANIEALTFEGEGTSHTHNVSSEINGRLSVMQFNTDWLTKVAGVAEVTASMPTGVARIWHPELGTYPSVQAELNLRVKDMTASLGSEKIVRLYIWAMLLQNPLLITGVGNLEATTLQFDWSSLAVTTDLWGAAIPGVTGTQTVHYSIAELT
jgi:hypothetical protein